MYREVAASFLESPEALTNLTLAGHGSNQLPDIDSVIEDHPSYRFLLIVYRIKIND